VLKKHGTKEYFDKSKLLAGLFHACQKRPVDAEKIANEIEFEILNGLKKEISSKEIGEMAMEKLRKIDDVAYVRFASVHREFKDIDTFMREISELKQEEEKKTNE
jgi:transcriptional repressor NrdR